MDKNQSKSFKSNSNLRDADERKKKNSLDNEKKDAINYDEGINPKRTNSKKSKSNGSYKDKNKNPKNSELYKDDSKSKPKTNPFYTINGRNGMIVDIPSTADADFSVLDVSLDLSALLKQPSGSEAFLSSEFCDSLNTIVKTYSTSRGYVTTVTGKVIANVLRLSMKAFSLLAAIWRTQAAHNLTAQNGLNVGRMFYRRSVHSVNSTLILLLDENSPSPVMIDESASISNSVWMRDYVSHLNTMYLPKVLVDTLLYLYKNAFTAEVGKGLGTGSLFLLWPISGNASLVSEYATTVTALRTLFTTYPDLELLLKVCGFDNKYAIEVDFTRPLAANVLSIVYDPSIPRLLENLGPLDCGYDSYASDVYCTYHEYDDIGSIFGFKDITTIDVTQNLLYWLINFNALSNLGVTLYPSAGDLCQVKGGLKVVSSNNVIVERMYLPENIHYVFTDWSNINATYLAGLATIMHNVASAQALSHGVTGLHSRRSLMVQIEVSVDQIEQELSFSQSLAISQCRDGANNYTYNEQEASVIMRNMLPTLIYGAEWRAKLQMVYENIANSVSGIRY